MIQSLQRRPIPKLGLVLNSIEVFDPVSKDRSERAIRQYFDELLESKQIDPASIITERIFGPHEALAVADRLAAAQVDVVVIATSLDDTRSLMKSQPMPMPAVSKRVGLREYPTAEAPG